MKTRVGLWIDHRKAVLSFHSLMGDESTTVILSNAERQLGRIDGERSTEAFESLLVPADDVQDRKFQQHLNHFYDEVIAAVHQAEWLLIFGPGEAKGELIKRLEKEKPSGRHVVVETADKLTDRQVAAKVREYFKADSPVIVCDH